MDDNLLISRLQTLGMDRTDAVRLVTTAHNRNTRVSWVFISSLAGIYNCIILIIAAYLFFILSIDKEGVIVFSAMYVPAILIIGFISPLFRQFFWSLKILWLLKGR